MRKGLWMVAVLAMACGDDPIIAPNLDLVGPGEVPNLETPKKTDVIVQVTKPEVDVLWVLDDSCSMIEEQLKLADNFETFINFFLGSGLDWHIGLVSTDTEDVGKSGKLQGAGGYRFLDATTALPIDVFRQMTQLGTGGAYTEKGLLAANLALTMPTAQIQQANRGFYRDEAALHIVAISDEDDQSAPLINRNEFITFLRDLKEDEDTPVTFSSIVGPVNGCSSSDGDAVAGTNYIAVTTAVGGLFRSICEDEWAEMLEELGLQAAGLRREYFLSEVPVPGSLEVWVVDGDFTYDGIDVETFPATSNLQAECRKRDLTNCFPYSFDAAHNSINLSDWVPSPLAQINIRYELLSGLQGEDAGLLGGGGAIDTGM